MPQEETFIVVPEGVTLNYLTRRNNPSRYYSFIPFEVELYGEENIIADFKSNPPDYFIIVHRNTNEFGVGYFGRNDGYGLKIAEWIYGNYEPVGIIGYEPLKDGKFGIIIMKRKESNLS
jgi:hypothetical protein